MNLVTWSFCLLNVFLILFCFAFLLSLIILMDPISYLKAKSLHLMNLIWSFSQLNVFLIVPCLLSFSGWSSMDPNLLPKTPISILMNLIWSFSGLSVFLIVPCLLSFSGWSSMDPNLLQKTPISEFDESDMEFSQLNIFLILPFFAFLLWLIIQSRSQSLTENPNFCIWWIWYGVLVCWMLSWFFTVLLSFFEWFASMDPNILPKIFVQVIIMNDDDSLESTQIF